MIKNETYFEGRVKNLSGIIKGQDFSVGIMKEGEYTFSTIREERWEIILGEMEVFGNDGKSNLYKRGDIFEVSQDSQLKALVKDGVSYIIFYK